MKVRHKLRNKLIVAFIAATLIPVFATGLYAIYISSNTLKAQAVNAQNERLNTIKNSIESFLSTTQSDLLFLSQSPTFTSYIELKTKKASADALKKQRKILANEFLALSRNRRIYYQIRYLDETGQEIVRIDSNTIRSQIIDDEKLQNKQDRYYFKNTMAATGNNIFVSPLDLNRERGEIEEPYKPVIRYALKITDQNNNKVGILILNIDANQFLGKLNNVRLVASSGAFAAHPITKRRWGAKRDLNTGINIKKEYPKWFEIITQRSSGTISNKKVTLSYQKIIVPSTSRNWTLIMQQNTSKILNSVNKFRITFFIIVAIAVFIAFIFALIFSIKITRPIEHLTELADDISKGKLVDNPVIVNDKGEIGQLAEAFERMRVSMLKAFEKLRHRR
jgi:methyl-accepting chemotaxis protein